MSRADSTTRGRGVCAEARLTVADRAGSVAETRDIGLALGLIAPTRHGRLRTADPWDLTDREATTSGQARRA